jgi:hypothetical protein
MLAAHFIQAGALRRAEILVNVSIQIQRAIYGQNHRDIAMNLNHRGIIAYKRGDLSNSLATLEAALKMKRLCLSESHPDIALIRSNIATIRGILAPA